MRSLRASLADCLRQAWPQKSHQELLLDLGERKDWETSDFEHAVDAVAAYFNKELLLPLSAASFPGNSTSSPSSNLRTLGERLADPAAPPGVARWVAGLAGAVGAAPKTLANSLSRGMSTTRREHRWLYLIERLLRGEMALDAWLYHRRTPSCVAAELARGGASSVLDAGDALLWLSLIALWQRRRPTSEARANRGQNLPRRQTPKPVASLRGSLLAQGQLQPLLRVAEQLPGPASQALLLLAAEAALTEAHLAPHAARKSKIKEAETGEDWLRAVEGILLEGKKIFSPEDEAVLRFRIDRMRSWRDKKPQQPPPSSITTMPYVRAAIALESRCSATPPERFYPHTPGLLMLLPQLRRLGWLEDP